MVGRFLEASVFVPLVPNLFTQGLPSRLQAPVTKRFGTAFGAQAGGYKLLTLGYVLNQYFAHIQGLSGQIQSNYF
jgi:hypothetical protein